MSPAGLLLFHGPAVHLLLGHALPGSITDLPLVPLQQVQLQTAVLHHGLAQGAADLHPVGAGILPGGCDEHRAGAALVLRVDGGVVLHLNPMVMPLPAERPQPHRHPHDPLPDVQVVGALVQQHAASLPVPGGPPVAGIIVGLRPIPVVDDPDEALDLPQRPLLYQVMELPE